MQNGLQLLHSFFLDNFHCSRIGTMSTGISFSMLLLKLIFWPTLHCGADRWIPAGVGAFPARGWCCWWDGWLKVACEDCSPKIWDTSCCQNIDLDYPFVCNLRQAGLVNLHWRNGCKKRMHCQASSRICEHASDKIDMDVSFSKWEYWCSARQTSLNLTLSASRPRSWKNTFSDKFASGYLLWWIYFSLFCDSSPSVFWHLSHAWMLFGPTQRMILLPISRKYSKLARTHNE